MIHSLLVAAWIIIFLILIRRWKFLHLPGVPIRWLQLAFLLRFIGGIAIWLVYTYHYTYRDTSDAFRYFDDAMLIYGCLPEEPLHYFKFIFGFGLDDPALTPVLEQFRGWHSSYTYGLANDNPTVIRINAVIALFSFGYYHVHTAFMAFFSMIGLVGIIKFFKPQEGKFQKWIFLSVMIFPTVLFWGSGVLKEPLLIAGLGLFLVFLQKTADKKYWAFAVLLPLLYFVLHIKPYAGLTLIPGVICYWILVYSQAKFTWLKVALVHLSLFLIALHATPVFKAGDLLYILQKKQQDFYNVAREYDAGSVIQIPKPESSIDLITQAPGALFRAYLRPHLLEAKSVFYLANALENIIIAILFIALIIGFYQMGKNPKPEWVLGLSFIVLLGVLIGEIVPVLGAVVRYKLPALPFLVYMGGSVIINQIQRIKINNSSRN